MVVIPQSLLKYSKSKNRAQMVDRQGGYGYFIKNEMSQKYLLFKFSNFFILKMPWLLNFISVGLFRSNLKLSLRRDK